MIVFGKNVFKEIINSNNKINKVILSNNFSDNEIINYLKNNNINTQYLDKNIMDKKYKGNHQGIVIDIPDYKYYSIEDAYDSNFIIMLDHLEDPHNFGAIIRTCEAAGVDYIIIPKNRSVEINSTVMKVSAGALNNMKIIEVNNLSSSIDKLKENGFWIYGTDMNGENYTDIKYDTKTVMIIGNEGTGISRIVREKCDFIISIPMIGKVNSLNASVSAGIVIYEVVRQRK
ncbi:MAG: 23S rRNA (guanosine(2251)-2'-O)-methyltransferase RlmB [Bacilli bacterium]|nr:23S rRNA (guanosine(2251)-2'-O)-methyltransferase RlmB [Bacilli bacterium]